MRILQLTSDWKWTGPAEPMLIGMQALRARGHRVELVCADPPADANRSLRDEATARGIEPIGAVPALRSAFAIGDGRRVRRLRRWLASAELAGPYDVVHCWHSRDHVLAARALARGRPASRDRRRTRLVRTLSTTERIPRWPWNRWLFGAGCDGLLCVSRAAVEQNRPIRGERAIRCVPGAVDFADLSIRRSREDVRDELGVPDGAWLVGVVARMQAHRRFDLLLEALRALGSSKPQIHLVLIGRGTHADRVVWKPARELGVSDRVISAGYRRDDYADVLNAMDAFTYLVPGSDGSCRALRQAAALGLPLIGTARGAIPEIIRDGETGLVVAEDAAAIASAWTSLESDAARVRRFGEAARRDAADRFRPERLASELEAFYLELLDRPQG